MTLQERPKNVFEGLVKPIRRLVEEKGFKTPTETQEKAIPKILEGKNILLIGTVTPIPKRELDRLEALQTC